MLVISGSQVSQGDSLYISRAGAYGTAVQVGDSTAVVRVQMASGPRDFTVSQNGMISGTRGAYWHHPIEVDLGKGQGAKVQKVQAVVNALLQVL